MTALLTKFAERRRRRRIRRVAKLLLALDSAGVRQSRLRPGLRVLVR